VTKGDLLAERAPADARAWYARAVAVLEDARKLDERATARWTEEMLARGYPRDAIPDYGDKLLYNNLSLAYLGADRPADALLAYERSRRLDPANPAHYVNISAVLLRLGRWEDAATTLFEAIALAPGNRDAGSRLVETYRAFAPDAHGLIGDGPNGPSLHLDHPIVRRHRCRAFDELARILTDGDLPAAAAAIRRQGAEACSG